MCYFYIEIWERHSPRFHNLPVPSFSSDSGDFFIVCW
nr:MAG TPA: hypothetical protein [Caudoviricetes sp.]DAM40582.1 MAG TPA: hypothetical protein [Caudoviricetes sp.]